MDILDQFETKGNETIENELGIILDEQDPFPFFNSGLDNGSGQVGIGSLINERPTINLLERQDIS